MAIGGTKAVKIEIDNPDHRSFANKIRLFNRICLQVIEGMETPEAKKKDKDISKEKKKEKEKNKKQLVAIQKELQGIEDNWRQRIQGVNSSSQRSFEKQDKQKKAQKPKSPFDLGKFLTAYDNNNFINETVGKIKQYVSEEYGKLLDHFIDLIKLGEAEDSHMFAFDKENINGELRSFNGAMQDLKREDKILSDDDLKNLSSSDNVLLHFVIRFANKLYSTYKENDNDRVKGSAEGVLTSASDIIDLHKKNKLERSDIASYQMLLNTCIDHKIMIDKRLKEEQVERELEEDQYTEGNKAVDWNSATPEDIEKFYKEKIKPIAFTLEFLKNLADTLFSECDEVTKNKLNSSFLRSLESITVQADALSGFSKLSTAAKLKKIGDARNMCSMASDAMQNEENLVDKFSKELKAVIKKHSGEGYTRKFWHGKANLSNTDFSMKENREKECLVNVYNNIDNMIKFCINKDHTHIVNELKQRYDGYKPLDNRYKLYEVLLIWANENIDKMKASLSDENFEDEEIGGLFISVHLQGLIDLNSDLTVLADKGVSEDAALYQNYRTANNGAISNFADTVTKPALRNKLSSTKMLEVLRLCDAISDINNSCSKLCDRAKSFVNDYSDLYSYANKISDLHVLWKIIAIKKFVKNHSSEDKSKLNSNLLSDIGRGDDISTIASDIIKLHNDMKKSIQEINNRPKGSLSDFKNKSGILESYKECLSQIEDRLCQEESQEIRELFGIEAGVDINLMECLKTNISIEKMQEITNYFSSKKAVLPQTMQTGLSFNRMQQFNIAHSNAKSEDQKGFVNHILYEYEMIIRHAIKEQDGNKGNFSVDTTIEDIERFYEENLAECSLLIQVMYEYLDALIKNDDDNKTISESIIAVHNDLEKLVKVCEYCKKNNTDKVAGDSFLATCFDDPFLATCNDVFNIVDRNKSANGSVIDRLFEHHKVKLGESDSKVAGFMLKKYDLFPHCHSAGAFYTKIANSLSNSTSNKLKYSKLNFTDHGKTAKVHEQISIVYDRINKLLTIFDNGECVKNKDRLMILLFDNFVKLEGLLSETNHLGSLDHMNSPKPKRRQNDGGKKNNICNKAKQIMRILSFIEDVSINIDFLIKDEAKLRWITGNYHDSNVESLYGFNLTGSFLDDIRSFCTYIQKITITDENIAAIENMLDEYIENIRTNAPNVLKKQVSNMLDLLKTGKDFKCTPLSMAKGSLLRLSDDTDLHNLESVLGISQDSPVNETDNILSRRVLEDINKDVTLKNDSIFLSTTIAHVNKIERVNSLKEKLNDHENISVVQEINSKLSKIYMKIEKMMKFILILKLDKNIDQSEKENLSSYVDLILSFKNNNYLLTFINGVINGTTDNYSDYFKKITALEEQMDSAEKKVKKIDSKRYDSVIVDEYEDYSINGNVSLKKIRKFRDVCNKDVPLFIDIIREDQEDNFKELVMKIKKVENWKDYIDNLKDIIDCPLCDGKNEKKEALINKLLNYKAPDIPDVVITDYDEGQVIAPAPVVDDLHSGSDNLHPDSARIPACDDDNSSDYGDNDLDDALSEVDDLDEDLSSDSDSGSEAWQKINSLTKGLNRFIEEFYKDGKAIKIADLEENLVKLMCLQYTKKVDIGLFQKMLDEREIVTKCQTLLTFCTDNKGKCSDEDLIERWQEKIDELCVEFPILDQPFLAFKSYLDDCELEKVQADMITMDEYFIPLYKRYYDWRFKDCGVNLLEEKLEVKYKRKSLYWDKNSLYGLTLRMDQGYEKIARNEGEEAKFLDKVLEYILNLLKVGLSNNFDWNDVDKYVLNVVFCNYGDHFEITNYDKDQIKKIEKAVKKVQNILDPLKIKMKFDENRASILSEAYLEIRKIYDTFPVYRGFLNVICSILDEQFVTVLQANRMLSTEAVFSANSLLNTNFNVVMQSIYVKSNEEDNYMAMVAYNQLNHMQKLSPMNMIGLEECNIADFGVICKAMESLNIDRTGFDNFMAKRGVGTELDKADTAVNVGVDNHVESESEYESDSENLLSEEFSSDSKLALNDGKKRALIVIEKLVHYLLNCCEESSNIEFNEMNKHISLICVTYANGSQISDTDVENMRKCIEYTTNRIKSLQSSNINLGSLAGIEEFLNSKIKRNFFDYKDDLIKSSKEDISFHLDKFKDKLMTKYKSFNLELQVAVSEDDMKKGDDLYDVIEKTLKKASKVCEDRATVYNEMMVERGKLLEKFLWFSFNKLMKAGDEASNNDSAKKIINEYNALFQTGEDGTDYVINTESILCRNICKIIKNNKNIFSIDESVLDAIIKSNSTIMSVETLLDQNWDGDPNYDSIYEDGKVSNQVSDWNNDTLSKKLDIFQNCIKDKLRDFIYKEDSAREDIKDYSMQDMFVHAIDSQSKKGRGDGMSDVKDSIMLIDRFLFYFVSKFPQIKLENQTIIDREYWNNKVLSLLEILQGDDELAKENIKEEIAISVQDLMFWCDDPDYDYASLKNNLQEILLSEIKDKNYLLKDSSIDSIALDQVSGVILNNFARYVRCNLNIPEGSILNQDKMQEKISALFTAIESNIKAQNPAKPETDKQSEKVRGDGMSDVKDTIMLIDRFLFYFVSKWKQMNVENQKIINRDYWNDVIVKLMLKRLPELQKSNAADIKRSIAYDIKETMGLLNLWCGKLDFDMSSIKNDLQKFLLDEIKDKDSLLKERDIDSIPLDQVSGVILNNFARYVGCNLNIPKESVLDKDKIQEKAFDLFKAIESNIKAQNPAKPEADKQSDKVRGNKISDVKDTIMLIDRFLLYAVSKVRQMTVEGQKGIDIKYWNATIVGRILARLPYLQTNGEIIRRAIECDIKETISTLEMCCDNFEFDLDSIEDKLQEFLLKETKDKELLLKEESIESIPLPKVSGVILNSLAKYLGCDLNIPKGSVLEKHQIQEKTPLILGAIKGNANAQNPAKPVTNPAIPVASVTPTDKPGTLPVATAKTPAKPVKKTVKKEDLLVNADLIEKTLWFILHNLKFDHSFDKQRGSYIIKLFGVIKIYDKAIDLMKDDKSYRSISTLLGVISPILNIDKNALLKVRSIDELDDFLTGSNMKYDSVFDTCNDYKDVKRCTSVLQQKLVKYGIGEGCKESKLKGKNLSNIMEDLITHKMNKMKKEHAVTIFPEANKISGANPRKPQAGVAGVTSHTRPFTQPKVSAATKPKSDTTTPKGGTGAKPQAGVAGAPSHTRPFTQPKVSAAAKPKSYPTTKPKVSAATNKATTGLHPSNTKVNSFSHFEKYKKISGDKAVFYLLEKVIYFIIDKAKTLPNLSKEDLGDIIMDFYSLISGFYGDGKLREYTNMNIYELFYPSFESILTSLGIDEKLDQANIVQFIEKQKVEYNSILTQDSDKEDPNSNLLRLENELKKKLHHLTVEENGNTGKNESELSILSDTNMNLDLKDIIREVITLERSLKSENVPAYSGWDSYKSMDSKKNRNFVHSLRVFFINRLASFNDTVKKNKITNSEDIRKLLNGLFGFCIDTSFSKEIKSKNINDKINQIISNLDKLLISIDLYKTSGVRNQVKKLCSDDSLFTDIIAVLERAFFDEKYKRKDKKDEITALMCNENYDDLNVEILLQRGYDLSLYYDKEFHKDLTNEDIDSYWASVKDNNRLSVFGFLTKKAGDIKFTFSIPGELKEAKSEACDDLCRYGDMLFLLGKESTKNSFQPSVQQINECIVYVNKTIRYVINEKISTLVEKGDCSLSSSGVTGSLGNLTNAIYYLLKNIDMSLFFNKDRCSSAIESFKSKIKEFEYNISYEIYGPSKISTACHRAVITFFSHRTTKDVLFDDKFKKLINEKVDSDDVQYANNDNFINSLFTELQSNIEFLEKYLKSNRNSRNYTRLSVVLKDAKTSLKDGMINSMITSLINTSASRKLIEQNEKNKDKETVLSQGIKTFNMDEYKPLRINNEEISGNIKLEDDTDMNMVSPTTIGHKLKVLMVMYNVISKLTNSTLFSFPGAASLLDLAVNKDNDSEIKLRHLFHNYCGKDKMYNALKYLVLHKDDEVYKLNKIYKDINQLINDLKKNASNLDEFATKLNSLIKRCDDFSPLMHGVCSFFKRAINNECGLSANDIEKDYSHTLRYLYPMIEVIYTKGDMYGLYELAEACGYNVSDKEYTSISNLKLETIFGQLCQASRNRNPINSASLDSFELFKLDKDELVKKLLGVKVDSTDQNRINLYLKAERFFDLYHNNSELFTSITLDLKHHSQKHFNHIKGIVNVVLDLYNKICQFSGMSNNDKSDLKEDATKGIDKIIKGYMENKAKVLNEVFYNIDMCKDFTSLQQNIQAILEGSEKDFKENVCSELEDFAWRVETYHNRHAGKGIFDKKAKVVSDIWKLGINQDEIDGGDDSKFAGNTVPDILKALMGSFLSEKKEEFQSVYENIARNAKDQVENIKGRFDRKSAKDNLSTFTTYQARDMCTAIVDQYQECSDLITELKDEVEGDKKSTSKEDRATFDEKCKSINTAIDYMREIYTALKKHTLVDDLDTRNMLMLLTGNYDHKVDIYKGIGAFLKKSLAIKQLESLQNKLRGSSGISGVGVLLKVVDNNKNNLDHIVADMVKICPVMAEKINELVYGKGENKGDAHYRDTIVEKVKCFDSEHIKKFYKNIYLHKEDVNKLPPSLSNLFYDKLYKICKGDIKNIDNVKLFKFYGELIVDDFYGVQGHDILCKNISTLVDPTSLIVELDQLKQYSEDNRDDKFETVCTKAKQMVDHIFDINFTAMNSCNKLVTALLKKFLLVENEDNELMFRSPDEALNLEARQELSEIGIKVNEAMHKHLKDYLNKIECHILQSIRESGVNYEKLNDRLDKATNTFSCDLKRDLKSNLSNVLNTETTSIKQYLVSGVNVDTIVDSLVKDICESCHGKLKVNTSSKRSYISQIDSKNSCCIFMGELFPNISMPITKIDSDAKNVIIKQCYDKVKEELKPYLNLNNIVSSYQKEYYDDVVDTSIDNSSQQKPTTILYELVSVRGSLDDQKNDQKADLDKCLEEIGLCSDNF